MYEHTFEQNIDEVTSRIRTILLAKSKDYNAGNADYLSNMRSSTIIGIHPVLGILLRVIDKLKRIQAFVSGGQLAVAEESVTDAVLDVIGYMIIIYCYFREVKDGSDV